MSAQHSSGGGLGPDDVAAILRVIDDSDFTEITLRSGDMTIVVRKGDEGELPAQPAAAPVAAAPAPAPVPAAPAPAAAPPPAPQPAPQRSGSLEAVSSPLLGTFYMRPSPGEDPFVAVGAEVTADTVVCIVEVMKMMNSIQAGVTGRIVEVLVEDGQLVESGTDLFLVEPNGTNGAL
jgi:acetyl-CoA carboxylase biotin carboxyl carrier protein